MTSLLLLAAAAACAAVDARSQVDPGLAATTVPAIKPTPQPVSSIDEAIEKARAYYRSAPFAEHVAMRVWYADGRERTSNIVARMGSGSRRSGASRMNEHGAIRGLAALAPEARFEEGLSAAAWRIVFWIKTTSDRHRGP